MRSHSLRRNALEKLATLSAPSFNATNGEDDLIRICKIEAQYHISGLENGTTGTRPMSARSLDALIALCKAAPLVQNGADAATLMQQVLPYLPEAHKQSLKDLPVHQHLPPWQILTYNITKAVLSLAYQHKSLKGDALACIDRTLEEFTSSAETAVVVSAQSDGSGDSDIAKRSLSTLQFTVSLLGFLRAASEHVQVWSDTQRASLVRKLHNLLSNQTMTAVEGALSAVRNARTTSRAIRDWKRWDRYLSTVESPLGAILLRRAFMGLVEASIALLIVEPNALDETSILDILLQRKRPFLEETNIQNSELLEQYTELVVNEMNLLDAGIDFLRLSSTSQQRLALEAKASSLRSYLCCTLAERNPSDLENILAWLETIATDPAQMADIGLAETVLKCMAVLAEVSRSIASSLTRMIPRLIIQSAMDLQMAQLAGECLARALRHLSQDAIISTLYSLGNVLSAGSADSSVGSLSILDGSTPTKYSGTQGPVNAAYSLLSLTDEAGQESTAAYGAVVRAIVSMASVCKDEKITALVIAMLAQKIGRISTEVDAIIVVETAAVGVCGGRNELRTLLRLYARIASEATINRNELLKSAILEARIRLARSSRKDTPLFEVYMLHLLGICVSGGDAASGATVDTTLASQLISQLFRPLAVLVSADPDHKPDLENEEELMVLSRDAWFNIVVHGFLLTSAKSVTHLADLQTLAQYTLPLVDENRADMRESGVDLNTVLRRGEGPQGVVEQKSALVKVLPQCESDIKGLSYADCVFLNAALLVTTLRARGGDCTAGLPYFLENKVKSGPMSNCMVAITMHSVDTYLSRALLGKSQVFAAPHIALQLATFFEGCCHRISKLQQAAVAAADRLISAIPSSLCQKASLFALLELLTLMWQSCLDTEADEYDWKSTYSSAKGNVTITLSDDAGFREQTLSNFHARARQWVSRAIDWAPLDVKGLLQAYLEDYEDEGAYGHVALGRSFAVEMGAAISNSDQRLAVLGGQQKRNINTASDFIAQYTTRQQYRHVEMSDAQMTLSSLERPSQSESEHLKSIAHRLRQHEHVPFDEIRDALRNAAGILSKSRDDSIMLIQDLVAIPFLVFTKKAINLGVAVWLGLMKENPGLESRVLAEIAAGWERSIRLRKGFFNPDFLHANPFFLKAEFAPTRWDIVSSRQQHVHNLLAPHLRLAHLLSSHFSSSRLTSPHVEAIYTRLIRITLLAMRKTSTHPLARELHFHLVLLALRLLKLCPGLDASAQWRIKDAVLSAGLAWFSSFPQWSFGSNKLHVKAEVNLLHDVCGHLQDLSNIGSKTHGIRASLRLRQELLDYLLRSELSRLAVWINPLSGEPKGASSSLAFAGSNHNIKDTVFVPLLPTAWGEDPRIAVHLAARYPTSQRLVGSIRQYLANDPRRAINVPEALSILLGASLPDDLKTQLRFLLYWAPVSPMAAAAYFLPSYGSHPLVIQYAIRALESHSVDITFFYVPQIVQTLRYDDLGYVERYIVETAKFSQLFAHQIIWNMKANSYKDNDAEVPDPAKPILDKVMDALISSFSKEDRIFYHREFDFFDKVTGISGTLKPFIKRPKPEKKAKIEEELRKIELDVGVYLPSNPDGVVIGIDRKSGRPLQSHAKAPYMATFRIRKDEIVSDEPVDVDEEKSGRKSIEVWQSAIFKVGDDVRQDVLALQLISNFRSIFNQVGLNVYLYPNRVTATAPGCGVIDVLPNSISRDMLGREAVNGLYEYFVSRYGSEDSIRFQEARGNFIKSMAGYSIISYLLQFKDRHNGNIMIDDAGHILHIDFGFCFDIAPGGVKFERAPFKLSPEMVAVMGGSTQSAPFKAFEELCVKAFLAARQYVEPLAQAIETMLDSGLPCFKPTTIQHFKERFVLDKSEREAADFVRKLVHWSERSYSTGVYDYFQLLTNGIPY